jgi:dihydroorotase-like cyclic amidohydrolase
MGDIVRGRHQLQAVHGLSGRAVARRSVDLSLHAAGRRDRRAHHHARRDGPAHRCPRGARRWPRAHRAHLPRLTRPEAAEATGTERAIALAEMAKVPVYIVHLSAARALERVMEARDRGPPAYAETCPQYLFLSDDELRGTPEDPFEGAKYVCTPPLRPHSHHEHLWRGLRNYDLQVVATDHCPFCMKDQKELGRDSFAKSPTECPASRPGCTCSVRGRAQGQDLAQPLRRDHQHRAGQDLRPVPA